MSTPETRVGYLFDERYLYHNPGLELMWTAQGLLPYPFIEPVLHPSSYRLVSRTDHLATLGGLRSHLTPLAPRPATLNEIRWIHTDSYIARVKELSDAGTGDAGEGALIGPGTFDIALLATGGAIVAVDSVLSGSVRRAFANIRPPGHHAIAEMGMGYCFFNNIAIAARHAQHEHGISRIAIVDWDVHHGNGTQAAFYDDPTVLFVSLHQDGLYPSDTGSIDQMGDGSGVGTTVNLPLPAGSGDAVYRAAFDRIVIPILQEFDPELILVSAGQDASILDPDGRMCLTTDAYRWMTSALMNAAEEQCDGRLVVCLEGGYSETYAPFCTVGILESLTGVRTGLPEPQELEHLKARPDVGAIGSSGNAAMDQLQHAHAAHWNGLRVS